jgi:hypothetical protein
MKPNEIQKRKLNLNKQTIQKLDGKKLSQIYAGELAADAADGTTLGFQTLLVGVSLVFIAAAPECLISIVGIGATRQS